MGAKYTSPELERKRHLRQVVILRKAGLSVEECAAVLDATVAECNANLKVAAVRGQYEPKKPVRHRWIDIGKLPNDAKRWLITQSRISDVSVEEMVFAIIKDAHAEETQ